MTPDPPTVVRTPEEALTRLRQGNRRFVAGRLYDRPWPKLVEETAGGQHPYAAVLGCVDSRVPPEIVFDEGIGDLFAVRVAGAVVGRSVIGSLEFCCGVAGAKAAVILGHTGCGAVAGTLRGDDGGHFGAIGEKIRPAVDRVRAAGGDPDDPDFATRVTVASVKLGLERLRSESDILSELESQGEVALVGALYDVASGEVRFF